jgi:alkylated DNA nucleotide flippase Atl1
MTDIWMGAGPVPEFLHRILNLLARTRARLSLPSFEPLSPLFYAMLNRMRFGEHRGGMFVRARGAVGGKAMQMSWHLLAEGDDGPYIPSMAIEAIVRRLLDGKRPEVGSRSGVRALELGDYDALFRGRTIFTGFRSEEPEAPLYWQLLGSAFNDLPPRLQELHGSRQARVWTGVAQVRRGRGAMARIIAAILGFPTAAAQAPVTVAFAPEKDGERWTRNFAGKIFTSTQSRGSGRDEYLLVERFGAISVALALVLDCGRLRLIPRRWRLWGIPMPRFLLPTGASFEAEEDNQFCFDVDISVPLIGLIVAYRGTLEPVAQVADHRTTR